MRKIFLAMVAVFCTANMVAQDVKGDVIIHTDMGDIVVVLYDETPKHKENFLKLAGEGFYTDLLFHRVIEDFMIQGGDPDSKNAKPGVQLGSGAVDYLIDAEFNPNLFHKKGALAAARRSDNLNSSGCQFYLVQGKTYTDTQLDQMNASREEARMQQVFDNFINAPENANYLQRLVAAQQNNDRNTYTKIIQEIEPKLMQIHKSDDSWKMTPEQREVYKTVGGTPFLDMQYTVFGEVIEGLDVIDKIAEVETDRNDRPTKDVKMWMEVIKK